MERAQNSDSETHVEMLDWTFGSDLSGKALCCIFFGTPCILMDPDSSWCFYFCIGGSISVWIHITILMNPDSSWWIYICIGGSISVWHRLYPWWWWRFPVCLGKGYSIHRGHIAPTSGCCTIHMLVQCTMYNVPYICLYNVHTYACTIYVCLL